jgi:hypothetical protein
MDMMREAIEKRASETLGPRQITRSFRVAGTK